MAKSPSNSIKKKSKNTASESANGKGNGANSQNNDDAASPQLDPAMLEKISQVRTKVHETFGKVALAMMALPRYRSLSLLDLNHILLEPLVRDRVAIASSASTNDDTPSLDSLSGIAIWASVSEEVDAKIREQIKAGVFPVRLGTDEWTSGSINWLFDVIAPNQKLTTSVIANFRQIVKEGDLRIHPLITRLVDPETLKKMGAAPVSKLAQEDKPLA
ncbi:MAG: toxin-activating lysine-acyltransferase [Hyphomicrobiales bacterium]|nr:toxin-activating lysine-acyltransferase [Hyphomicrobiales bacterium]